jgi:hypothetical protein
VSDHERSPEELLLGIERPTPEQEAEAEKTRKKKIELRRAFLIQQMQNPLFREWLMEKLARLQAFSRPFGLSPTGFPDPMATMYYQGMKDAGWSLWEEFDGVAPELASQMRREAGQPRS